MASSDKKRKSKQKWSPGSGWRRARLAKKGIVRTKMKIARWERYQAEIQAGTRPPAVFRHGKKKGEVDNSRWDTTGLKSHLSKLQSIVKMGKTG